MVYSVTKLVGRSGHQVGSQQYPLQFSTIRHTLRATRCQQLRLSWGIHTDTHIHTCIFMHVITYVTLKPYTYTCIGYVHNHAE